MARWTARILRFSLRLGGHAPEACGLPVDSKTRRALRLRMSIEFCGVADRTQNPRRFFRRIYLCIRDWRFGLPPLSHFPAFLFGSIITDDK